MESQDRKTNKTKGDHKGALHILLLKIQNTHHTHTPQLFSDPGKKELEPFLVKAVFRGAATKTKSWNRKLVPLANRPTGRLKELKGRELVLEGELAKPEGHRIRLPTETTFLYLVVSEKLFFSFSFSPQEEKVASDLPGKLPFVGNRWVFWWMRKNHQVNQGHPTKRQKRTPMIETLVCQHKQMGDRFLSINQD